MNCGLSPLYSDETTSTVGDKHWSPKRIVNLAGGAALDTAGKAGATNCTTSIPAQTGTTVLNDKPTQYFF
jgi:hypothetical protein